MAFLRQIPVQYKGIQQKGLLRWTSATTIPIISATSSKRGKARHPKNSEECIAERDKCTVVASAQVYHVSKRLKIARAMTNPVGVKFPAKLSLKGNIVLSSDVLPRLIGFGGVSRGALGHFCPPNGFRRVISERKLNFHIKRLYQIQKILFWF